MALDFMSFVMGKSTSSGGTQPSGSLDITENGEYDVSQYATAIVDVSGGGKNIIPLENIFTDIPCEIKVIINA